MEENKKSFFELLSKTQALILGAVAAFLILCTIGFFILLGLMLNGSIFGGDVSADKKSDINAPKKFSECLDSGKTAAKVSADEQLGASIGVQGTPATFINGYLISGALPYEAVKVVVDAVLAGKDPAKEPRWNKDSYGELAKTTMPELKDAVWRGNKDAKVSLVEFSDFECPYCNRFEPTVAKVVEELKDKVRFTYRNFPLSFHTQAQKAAEAFECAKEQGQAFEMHDKLFELSRDGKLSLDNFKKAASELGLK